MIILLAILNLAGCSLTINFVQNGSSLGRFNFDSQQQAQKSIHPLTAEPIDIEVVGKRCNFPDYKLKQAIWPTKGSFKIEVGSQPYMTQVR